MEELIVRNWVGRDCFLTSILSGEAPRLTALYLSGGLSLEWKSLSNFTTLRALKLAPSGHLVLDKPGFGELIAILDTLPALEHLELHVMRLPGSPAASYPTISLNVLQTLLLFISQSGTALLLSHISTPSCRGVNIQCTSTSAAGGNGVFTSYTGYITKCIASDHPPTSLEITLQAGGRLTINGRQFNSTTKWRFGKEEPYLEHLFKHLPAPLRSVPDVKLSFDEKTWTEGQTTIVPVVLSAFPHITELSLPYYTPNVNALTVPVCKLPDRRSWRCRELRSIHLTGGVPTRETLAHVLRLARTRKETQLVKGLNVPPAPLQELHLIPRVVLVAASDFRIGKMLQDLRDEIPEVVFDASRLQIKPKEVESYFNFTEY